MNKILRKSIVERKKRVLEKLKPNQILVLFSHPNVNECSLPINGNYKANCNFYYLTGLHQPNLIAVLTSQDYFIFAPKYSKQRYVWDSGLVGVNELNENKNFYLIDRIKETIKFNATFLKLCQKRRVNELICQINYDLNNSQNIEPQIQSALVETRAKQTRSDQNLIRTFINSDDFFKSIRTLKTPSEIETIAHSVEIAAKSHLCLAQNIKNFHNEKELMNSFLYQSSEYGADGLAYPSIVATGSNGCILHYRSNNQAIKKTDTLLIDAGSSYQSYASDITRVYAKSGKFVGAMRDLYTAVYQVQTHIIDSLNKIQTWQDLENLAINQVSRALIDLKLLNQSLDEVIETGLYKRFYMHRVGHFLGLDVHDSCTYKDENNHSVKLDAGMVFTIEPGIYIHSSEKVNKAFKGLAVRIEDDIALDYPAIKSSNNYQVRVLSKSAIKEINQLENLMHG